jgi:hypothetical protein
LGSGFDPQAAYHCGRCATARHRDTVWLRIERPTTTSGATLPGKYVILIVILATLATGRTARPTDLRPAMPTCPRCGRQPSPPATANGCSERPSSTGPLNGQSAGINRHGGDENALHRRSSDPRWPESCVGVCEGVGEALTGVRAGQLLSREINEFGVPTSLSRTEGHPRRRYARVAVGIPRGRRTCACTESPCARTGRSHDRPSG